jgi:7-keto-8-aminopelargonate synthetase-like enzyme
MHILPVTTRARKVIYKHCDLPDLRKELDKRRNEPGARVIVTESVFSMDGDLAPLVELQQLAREYDADLIIDEAHASGVFGPNGRGCAAELGIEREVLAIVHTCGKALASMGAFVCSSRILTQYLVNRARTFIFSTAAPPYLAHQIRAAVRLASSADCQRHHLLAIQELVRTRLRGGGLNVGPSHSQIIPVVMNARIQTQKTTWVQVGAFALIQSIRRSDECFDTPHTIAIDGDTVYVGDGEKSPRGMPTLYAPSG